MSQAPPSPVGVGSVDLATRALQAMQLPHGGWEGEMRWCSVMTSQYVLVAHLLGEAIPEAQQASIRHYLSVRQRDDGSWGLHPQSEGYLFVTALAYVALRIMGDGPDAPVAARALAWIRAEGGIEQIPSWGRIWLAVFGLYGWDGLQPSPPELWLLPEAAPIHPRRMYCHTRLIYLGMGVLWARRPVHTSSLTEALRRELYLRDYDAIDFKALRGQVREAELYAPPTALLDGVNLAAGLGTRFVPGFVRRKALARCMGHIAHEQAHSRYIGISPVSAMLHLVAQWSMDPAHEALRPGFDALVAWFWEDEDGLRVVGARSQVWDTAFAVQALTQAPDADAEVLAKAHAFLLEQQVIDEWEGYAAHYQLPRLGGWCFTTQEHRWPVSDCTAESLVALHKLEGRGLSAPPERLDLAARFILLRANADGGFGSYEANRGGDVLKRVNPTEMYGNCMVEISYTECTASCLRGLSAWLHMRGQADPELRNKVSAAVSAGVAYLRSAQLNDGSWLGYWGINFTYGSLFAIEGLLDAGVDATDPSIQRARAWLREHQLPDGGWGETAKSCETERYEAAAASQVVQTSWALEALVLAGERDEAVLGPAVALLESRQRGDGTWALEDVEGVFFNTSALQYCLYRAHFTLRSLARVKALLSE